MHKMVYQVFKTLMLSMLLVMVFDITSYLYRAMSLNTRVENIMTSLQRVVSENNGLPNETAETYEKLFNQMAVDYNTNGNNQPFVLGIGWNKSKDVDLAGIKATSVGNIKADRKYLNEGSGTYSSNTVSILHKNMQDIGDYGDIHCCQVRIAVAQPMWGFTSMNSATYVNSSTKQNSAAAWGRQGYASTVFYYTYFTPDIKYKSVTQ